MFQSVRPNSQVYILHKGTSPKLDIGLVVNTPIPKPKYSIPNYMPQEMVVDLSVKVDNQVVNYNSLPAQADIADSYADNITISDSKDAMNAEILGLKQKSVDLVNSVDEHKALITQYESILSELNPEFAEKQAQKEELNNLKEHVKEMSDSIKDLMESNRKLIEHLSK